jgi:hypothetical protein
MARSLVARFARVWRLDPPLVPRFARVGAAAAPGALARSLAAADGSSFVVADTPVHPAHFLPPLKVKP